MSPLAGERAVDRTLLLTRGGKPWEGLQPAYDRSIMSTWSSILCRPSVGDWE
jgi:hypothetical protein